jgi:hypothetical protein
MQQRERKTDTRKKAQKKKSRIIDKEKETNNEIGAEIKTTKNKKRERKKNGINQKE